MAEWLGWWTCNLVVPGSLALHPATHWICSRLPLDKKNCICVEDTVYTKNGHQKYHKFKYTSLNKNL